MLAMQSNADEVGKILEPFPSGSLSPYGDKFQKSPPPGAEAAAVASCSTGPTPRQGGSVSPLPAMADAPYLIALAFIEQNGGRALPLAGKSLSPAAAAAEDPGAEGRTLALELLLRLWQRSEEGPLRRAVGDASLLLVEMPMVVMSEQLPRLKARWVKGGDTGACLEALRNLVSRAWRITIDRHEPVTFVAWP